MSEARKLRPVEGVEIKIPAIPKSSSNDILRKYDFLRKIEKDDSPEGEVVMTFATVLREYENSISGKEYETRFVGLDGKLGFSQALWIVENQDKLPKEIHELLGKIYVDFPATVAVGAGGSRYVPCLRAHGGRWFLRWSWLGSDFYSDDRVARSRK